METVQLTRFLVSAEATGLPFKLVFNKVCMRFHLLRVSIAASRVLERIRRPGRHTEITRNLQQVDLMSPEERADYEGRLRQGRTLTAAVSLAARPLHCRDCRDCCSEAWSGASCDFLCRGWGYDPLFVSVRTGEGIEKLRSLLSNQVRRKSTVHRAPRRTFRVPGPTLHEKA